MTPQTKPVAHASRLAPDARDRLAALRITPVSRETEQRLDRFVDLLLVWQAKTNLIARSTIPRLWTRHIADSLQLLSLAPHAYRWVDLGSGGGFPGLVLACALAEKPGAIIHLVESNARKAAFLREVTRVLRIPAIVHCARIEDFIADESVTPAVVTARAVAPLDKLAGLIAPFVKKGAVALILKGQDVEEELKEATKSWIIGAELVPSKTDRAGQILVVRSLERRNGCS
ncbi:MAG: 16S rRNA (guanine(527)-N(7))-methyltransferase RsmG [Rhodoplanes sp.]|jgi:16S rRNA (guanine527-N7)-methyltransferase